MPAKNKHSPVVRAPAKKKSQLSPAYLAREDLLFNKLDAKAARQQAEREEFERRTRAQLDLTPDAPEDEPNLEVEREVSAEEHAETAKLVNTLLLDYAQSGFCGTPGRFDPKVIRSLQTQAERAEFNDHASAEPLKYLGLVFEYGDSEACAQGLGAVWRSAHPFRPVVDGDPYTILAPQIDRRLALRALDQAAALPAPRVGVFDHMRAVKNALDEHHADFACVDPATDTREEGPRAKALRKEWKEDRGRQYPCSRMTALAVVEEAHSALRLLLDETSLKDRNVLTMVRAVRLMDHWMKKEPVTKARLTTLWELTSEVGEAADNLKSAKLSSAVDRAANMIDHATLYISAYAYNRGAEAGVRTDHLNALQETSRPWLAPVVLGATLLGGLALAFVFVSPDRGA